MVAERLGKYIVFKGISYYAFENDLGVSRGSISKAVKENKSIGSNVLENILIKYSDLNVEWLLTGRGNMLRTEDIQLAPTEVKGEFSLRSDHKIGMQSIPLYELDATAGLVALFDDNIRQVPISHLQIPNLPSCDGAIYVHGDSMYPLLKSGDIICYKEVDANFILWGEMYLLSFIIDGETYIAIKYIQKSDDERCVRLVSHNPHHAPKDIPLDAIRALALVKASVRYNTMG